MQDRDKLPADRKKPYQEINVSEETKKDAGQESSKNQPLPLWRRIAFALVILALIGMAGIMLGGLVVGKMLGSKVEAMSKAGHPTSFAQLAENGEVIRTEDAGAIYTALITNLPIDDLKNLAQLSHVFRRIIAADTLDQQPEEMKESIVKNLQQLEPILAGLDKAAKLPISEFDTGIQNGMEFCTKRILQVQKAILFLSLRNTFLISEKKYDQAAMSIVSMLKASRVFDTYPTMVASNAKLNILGLACEDIRMLMQKGKVSDGMLDKLIAALGEAAGANTLERTLQAEQVYRLEIARDLIPESTSLKIMEKDVPIIPERVNLPSSSLGKIKLRLTVADFFKEMDRLVTAAGQEWPGPFDYAVKNKDKVAAKLKEAFKGIYAYIQAATSNTAVVNEITLALHLEKYRRANGSLPESLDQIAKELDPALMTDPYTGGKLMYKKEDLSYLIYSTGPDKVDNGGALQAQISQTTGKIEKMPDDLGIKMLVPTE
jgi:hypothetical protein